MLHEVGCVDSSTLCNVCAWLNSWFALQVWELYSLDQDRFHTEFFPESSALTKPWQVPRSVSKSPLSDTDPEFLSFGPALVFLRFLLPWFPIWIFLMGNCGILGKIPSKFLLLPFIPLLCHSPYLPPSPPPTLLSHKEVDIKCFDITL